MWQGLCQFPNEKEAVCDDSILGFMEVRRPYTSGKRRCAWGLSEANAVCAVRAVLCCAVLRLKSIGIDEIGLDGGGVQGAPPYYYVQSNQYVGRRFSFFFVGFFFGAASLGICHSLVQMPPSALKSDHLVLLGSVLLLIRILSNLGWLHCCALSNQILCNDSVPDRKSERALHRTGS